MGHGCDQTSRVGRYNWTRMVRLCRRNHTRRLTQATKGSRHTSKGSSRRNASKARRPSSIFVKRASGRREGGHTSKTSLIAARPSSIFVKRVTGRSRQRPGKGPVIGMSKHTRHLPWSPRHWIPNPAIKAVVQSLYLLATKGKGLPTIDVG